MKNHEEEAHVLHMENRVAKRIHPAIYHEVSRLSELKGLWRTPSFSSEKDLSQVTHGQFLGQEN